MYGVFKHLFFYLYCPALHATLCTVVMQMLKNVPSFLLLVTKNFITTETQLKALKGKESAVLFSWVSASPDGCS